MKTTTVIVLTADGTNVPFREVAGWYVNNGFVWIETHELLTGVPQDQVKWLEIHTYEEDGE